MPPEPSLDPEYTIPDTDVVGTEADDGLRLDDLGSSMVVTIPDDHRDDVAQFIENNADTHPSRITDDFDVHAQHRIDDNRHVSYWTDGLFGVTDDARESTITFDQQVADTACAILTDE